MDQFDPDLDPDPDPGALDLVRPEWVEVTPTPTAPQTARPAPRPAGVSLSATLLLQDGVITRSQLHELGDTPGDVERRLRRHELVRLADGVFVNHNGPRTWRQRAWIAILHAWPAALAGTSAWQQPGTIEVAIGQHRSLAPMSRIVWRRTTRLLDRAEWVAAPPRIAVRHAALDAAATAEDDFAAVALLSDVVQGRHTTYAALQDALLARGRLRRGTLIRAVVADLALGANSVLEREYLHRVEQPHGLPTPQRQRSARIDGRLTVRDVEYAELGLVIELDGRTFHDSATARDADLDRDLAAAATGGALTLRLGWGQVLRRPCATAARIADVLRCRGWTGEPVPCAACRGDGARAR